MEFLPSLPSVPSDQAAALNERVASNPGNNDATGSYDETFMAVLAGRQGPASLPLPVFAEPQGGEVLPLDVHSPGNELPAIAALDNVEPVLPASPLLASPYVKIATVDGIDAEQAERSTAARYLPMARTSVPLAVYEQSGPAVVVDHQAPVKSQTNTSLAPVVPVVLQIPALAQGRLTRQETIDVSTQAGAPARADALTASLFANNGIGSLLTFSTSPSNTAFASEQLSVPFNQPDWGRAFGEKILWLVGNNVRQAELRLNPPELGPLEVRIAVDRDQASVLFTSQHTLVRDAVEATIPRLRELMAAGGFTEVDVNVGQHWLGSQDRAAGRSDAAYHPAAVASDDSHAEEGSAHLRQAQMRLVDLYV